MPDLIDSVADLTPATTWGQTVWACTGEEELVDHATKPRLCVATLLPFASRRPDWAGFARSVRWMLESAEHYGVELVCVLNADTGYIFDLGDELYAEVLRRFREEFPGRRFIAGVTARGAEQDSQFRADRYHPLLDIAQEYDGCEVMIMTSRLLDQLPPEARRDAYFQIADRITRPAIVHALGHAFVPWATPFGPWLFHELATHPTFTGGKVSTLDEPHFLYWTAMCRDQRLSFLPHSGDDYGLATAIRLGRPLLIGAGASACPLICAALDMWLRDGAAGKRFPSGTGRFDTRVYKVFEAIQSLEDVVFRLDGRRSAAAYKHSTAHVLHQLGLVTAPEPHPDCRDRRGDDEAERMAEALRRPLQIARELGIPGFATAAS